MFKITIDENRKQNGRYSGYAAKEVEGIIEVDCASPSENHSLKTNYKDFKGKNQWKVDAGKKKKHERSEKLKAKHAKALDRLVWQEVLKDTDLDADDKKEINKKLTQ